MKRHSKFKTTEQQEQVAAEHQTQASAPLEFQTPEELLRYDAEHVTVPGNVAQRLQKSIGPLSAPERSWWQRLFGGGKE